jgi:hypothetical protein
LQPVAASALAVVDAGDASGGPLTGGASGALIYRVDAPGRPLLLRLETARDPVRDPRRTYPIMRAAAEVGVAPAVHHADADAGVVVMDLIDQRPLGEHPGGPAAIVAELGERIALLQTCALAPGLLEDFGAVLERMVGMIAGSGLFADGVVDPAAAAFAQLRRAYPWDADPEVTSHNDLNPFNVLSDGRRLWLVDWELAFRNDRFNDIAVVANNFAATPELETLLLGRWLHRPPHDGDRARLTVMRALSRLFYGCLLLSTAIGRQPQESTLTAPTPEELAAAVERGEHDPTSGSTLHTLGKMQLVAFVGGMADPALQDAIARTSG